MKYWKAIAALSEGTFLNKNNADCVRDEITRTMLPYHERHLEGLGDYLLAYYDRAIAAAGLARQGRGRGGAVPLADGFRLLVDGRLAEEPGRRGRARTCSW